MNTVHAWLCRHTRTVHPDFAALLDHADGRMSAAVGQHLARCGRCRQEAARLSAAVCRPSAGAALADIHSDLKLRMQAWLSLGGGTAAEQTSRQLEPGRLAGALDLYFGRRAATRIQACVSGHVPEPRLIPIAKPLFSAFLGRRAADALASRIAAATG